MVALKSRTNCPPNGFQFVQPQTNWGDGRKWWDFELLCHELQAHRIGNPRFNLPTDLNVIRAEVDQTNALRCMSIKGGDLYVVNNESIPNILNLPPDAIPKSSAPRSVAPVGAVGADDRVTTGAGMIEKIAAGVGTLDSWLGDDGKPVDGYLANARAFICTKCPKNGKGDWSRFFTIPAAAMVKRNIERRNRMKLATPHDARLGVCEACLCPLKLKVHTPIKKIVEHMPDEVKAELHPDCWVLSES